MLSCSKFYYLCLMNSLLQQLGNIPVTASTLASLFPYINGGSQKVRLLERNKQIIRLKKGLYIELIANHLYAPSYVSMSSALRYYALIPETVYTNQSMTFKHAKAFDTPLGRFEYTHISREAFSIGLSCIQKDDYAFVIATPEKALCDLIANSTNVNLRYLKDAEMYLEEDIRMERDDFKQMDAGIFEEYIKVGKKNNSIQTLLKLLKK